MKQFSGFPTKAQFTPIPNLFFSSLLPQITDIAELKVTLHLFWSIYAKRGYPRFITYRELLANAGLMSGLKIEGKSSEEVLGEALAMAVKRGTLLHLVLDVKGAPEAVYFLNTESERQVVAKIRNGELNLAGLKAGVQMVETEPLPDIFSLYEQNIGMLTPMIAEELREAEKLYPEIWIKDAIKGAVNQNKRRWSYISAILEGWATEGKSDGTYQRGFKETEPDKYNRQKYGHMVQH